MKTLKEFFGFTKKELNGLIILCVLIFVIAISPSIYSVLNPPRTYNYKAFEKEIEEFMASSEEEKAVRFHYKSKYHKDLVKPEYFVFNPNGLSEANWKRLGLKTWQVKVIKNFEAKGGKFFRKEDLQKIYSIKPEDYARLEPYINIPEKNFDNAASKTRLEHINKKTFSVVELNTADSTQLETLKGIGPTYAARIIKYRNRLGGFYRKEQLLEVYGVDSAKFAAFSRQVDVDVTLIQKLNINTAKFEDLKRNPYLNYKQMNAIVQYRKQHGLYQSVDDLKKIVILPDDVIRKIAPYIIF